MMSGVALWWLHVRSWDIQSHFTSKEIANRDTVIRSVLVNIIEKYCNSKYMCIQTCLYFCTWTSINLGEWTYAHIRLVCWLCPDAWLTGPSKNGADINRLGRSHVSVYTGRPQSCSTRALDSLCTAKSHTIYLCLEQKHLFKYTTNSA